MKKAIFFQFWHIIILHAGTYGGSKSVIAIQKDILAIKQAKILIYIYTDHPSLNIYSIKSMGLIDNNYITISDKQEINAHKKVIT